LPRGHESGTLSAAHRRTGGDICGRHRESAAPVEPYFVERRTDHSMDLAALPGDRGGDCRLGMTAQKPGE
jgi:hypothetical protein